MMVSWSIISGRCPWCGSDRETLYATYDQKICMNCILKLYQSAMKDFWVPLIKEAESRLETKKRNE